MAARRRKSSTGQGGKASTGSVPDAGAPGSARESKHGSDAGSARLDATAEGADGEDGDTDSATLPDKQDSERTALGAGDDEGEEDESGPLPAAAAEAHVDDSPWAHNARFGFLATDPRLCSKGVRVRIQTSIKMVCQLSPEELADFCKALNLVIKPTINKSESTDDRIYVLTAQPIAHFSQEPSCIMMLLHDGMKSLKKMVANYIPKKNRRDHRKGNPGVGKLGKKKKPAVESSYSQPKSKVNSRVGSAKSRFSQADTFNNNTLQPERISSALSRISRINTARERHQMQLGSAGSRIETAPVHHPSVSSKASQDDTASETQAAPKPAKTPPPSNRRRSKQPEGSSPARPSRGEAKEKGGNRANSIEKLPAGAATAGHTKDLSGKRALPPISKAAAKRGAGAAKSARPGKKAGGKIIAKVPLIMTWSSSDSDGDGGGGDSGSGSDTDSDTDSEDEDGGGGAPPAPTRKPAKKHAKKPVRKPPVRKLPAKKPAARKPILLSSGSDGSDGSDSDSDFEHF